MVSPGLALHYFLLQFCEDESAPSVPHPVEVGGIGQGTVPPMEVTEVYEGSGNT